MGSPYYLLMIVVSQEALDSREFLDPPSLSHLLHVSVPTLYGWRYRRVGPPAYRIGRHLRYRRSEVEEWLRDQCAGA